MSNQKVPRPVSYADVLVVIAGFFHNLAETVSVFTEELMELSIYHANREAKVGSVWQDFTNDLESIQEEKDGS